MKTTFGSRFFETCCTKRMLVSHLILSVTCVMFMCGCSGPRRGELHPIDGIELQASKSGVAGQMVEWQVLASSAEISRIVYCEARSGLTEIWFQFSAEHYKALMKSLHDHDEPRRFRVVRDRQVVCTFEWDVFASVGHPDICIRLHNPKEAQRLLGRIGMPVQKGGVGVGNQ